MGIEEILEMLPVGIREKLIEVQPMEEIRRLNRNLEELVEVLKDIREMAAPLLGFRVK